MAVQVLIKLLVAKFGAAALKFLADEFRAGKSVKEIANDIEKLLFGFDPTPDAAKQKALAEHGVTDAPK